MARYWWKGWVSIPAPVDRATVWSSVIITRLPAAVFMYCYVLEVTGGHTQMDGNDFSTCPIMDFNSYRHLFCTEDPDTFGYSLLTNRYRKFTQQWDSTKK